jgi:hypothetical protein
MTIARASFAEHEPQWALSLSPFRRVFINILPSPIGSAAFPTVYLSRRVVHVSEFKEWKSEPISQKTSRAPGRARCTQKSMRKSCIVNCIRRMQNSLLSSHRYA